MQVTLTSKGQLTLPKAVRDALGLKPGHRLEVEILPDDLRTRPIRLDSLAVTKVLPPPRIRRPLWQRALEEAIRQAAVEWFKRTTP